MLTTPATHVIAGGHVASIDNETKFLRPNIDMLRN